MLEYIDRPVVRITKKIIIIQINKVEELIVMPAIESPLQDGDFSPNIPKINPGIEKRGDTERRSTEQRLNIKEAIANPVRLLDVLGGC